MDLGFGLGYKYFWVLGLGFGFGYKNFWVGFGYKNFWVLGLGLGFGFEYNNFWVLSLAQTQNPKIVLTVLDYALSEKSIFSSIVTFKKKTV